MNYQYLNVDTGRRRKLSNGAMIDICSQYASGSSVTTLAEAYGVSTNLIYTIVYWTPRDTKEEE